MRNPKRKVLALVFSILALASTAQADPDGSGGNLKKAGSPTVTAQGTP